jgi:hypothetical protein
MTVGDGRGLQLLDLAQRCAGKGKGFGRFARPHHSAQ